MTEKGGNRLRGKNSRKYHHIVTFPPTGGRELKGGGEYFDLISCNYSIFLL